MKDAKAPVYPIVFREQFYRSQAPGAPCEGQQFEVNITDDEVTTLLVLRQAQRVSTCSHVTSIRDTIH